MSIYPERPESVVEIEDNKFRKGERVCECGWRGVCGGRRGCEGWNRALAELSGHCGDGLDDKVYIDEADTFLYIGLISPV